MAKGIVDKQAAVIIISCCILNQRNSLKSVKKYVFFVLKKNSNTEVVRTWQPSWKLIFAVYNKVAFLMGNGFTFGFMFSKKNKLKPKHFRKMDKNIYGKSRIA